MRCIHGIELADPCERCAFEADDFYDEPEEEQPGPDDYCYLGHAWCYDDHYAERRADEADWEAEREADYFLPPTCPDCFGIMSEDGTHWASESLSCPAKGNQ